MNTNKRFITDKINTNKRFINDQERVIAMTSKRTYMLLFFSGLFSLTKYNDKNSSNLMQIKIRFHFKTKKTTILFSYE